MTKQQKKTQKDLQNQKTELVVKQILIDIKLGKEFKYDDPFNAKEDSFSLSWKLFEGEYQFIYDSHIEGIFPINDSEAERILTSVLERKKKKSNLRDNRFGLTKTEF